MLGFLGIDQYGQKYILTTKHPRKELLDDLEATHADKMYVDTKDGKAKHIGYVIKGLWIRLHTVYEWVGNSKEV